jgi:hypothetical protein
MLWLEIQPALVPITGRLGDEQKQWSFRGWLELAAALQTALGAPRGRTPPNRSHSSPTSTPAAVEANTDARGCER